MPKYIDVNDVTYSYNMTGSTTLAVGGVTLEIEEGSNVAILGRNGSGKSTLAKLISSLEFPNSGLISIDGIVVNDEHDLEKIRRLCTLIFQNPDNQIIGTTVEEDIAFGPENIGMPREMMRQRIDECANIVGLTRYLKSPPSSLSGGQKQKLAIAGVLALRPRIMILDESTSMLDPLSRKSFISTVEQLIKEFKITVIQITHHMDEALRCDKIFVMDKGKICLEGTPNEVFKHVKFIQEKGLDVPAHMAVTYDFLSQFSQSEPVLQTDEQGCIDKILSIINDRNAPNNVNSYQSFKTDTDADKKSSDNTNDEAVITVKNLTYTYPSTGKQKELKHAIQDVSFQVMRGNVFGIMGHTGSGKSTLIQHLNGLLRPTNGEIWVLGENTSKNKSIREIRRHVGLLFQYPEHQLFAETVAEDIAYGPIKMGSDPKDIPHIVSDAIISAGLDESFLSKSPFELSGGQKRRVALAGILAMNPEILVLDEPASGLDPAGREDILRLIKNLSSKGKTIILVSHSMDDLARVCDKIAVLKDGKLMKSGTVSEIFDEDNFNPEWGVDIPVVTSFMKNLSVYCPGIDTNCFSIDDAVNALNKYMYKKLKMEEI